MINWLVFSTFVFSMAMTILGLLVDLTYQVQFAPKVAAIQTQQQGHLKSYLQNTKTYSKHPIFRSHSTKKMDFANLIEKIRQGDLQKPLIDQKVKKTIYSMGHKWMDQKHKIPKLETVELLFAEIEKYDHWILPFDPNNDLASDLIVADQIFLAWTFYFQPNAIKQALEKSRHLGEILLTTQDLNFKRAGLSILEKETELLSFLKTRYRNYQLLWTPVTPYELKKFRHHLRQTASYLSPLTEPQLFQRVFFNKNLPTGFCSIIKEKMKLLMWSDAFLRPRIPLEPDFSKTLQNITKAQTRAQEFCHNWQTQQHLDVSWFRHIPFYRRIYGTKMIINAEKKRKIL